MPLCYALNNFNELTKILRPEVHLQLDKWSIRKSIHIWYSQYWQHQLQTAAEEINKLMWFPNAKQYIISRTLCNKCSELHIFSKLKIEERNFQIAQCPENLICLSL